MGIDVEQVVEEYKTIFSQMKKKLRWQMTDERFLMMISSLYIINGKPFDLQRFAAISDYIKKNVGMFSTLKSTQRFSTAAMLDLRFEKPEKKFHELLDVYEKLVKGGFRRGSYTYIAGLSLLTKDAEAERNHDELINRAMDVFKGMKKGHLFLTGESDYPLAVLLAQLNRPVEDMLDRMDNYYEKLSKTGFRKGNDLQFLSHILALQTEAEANELIDRCNRLAEDFKQAGRRVKRMYYPSVGLLATLESSSEEVENVMSFVDRLNGDQQFRWQKDMNFITAVNFIVKDKVEDTDVVSAGIQTTIESLIQAQQAAMIAMMAAAGSAAAASSSSN
ncbi:Protein of unknown function [Evansella caseinilytica]|uniref:DUF4003 domain-containing protein n=1 Tax=Evansella caseinilytica TaxID=1503961 RepID=A0A1H3HZE8_9BACI|nr:DUF4003 family protein [Evansella caseinilytica]SDY20742.1 Protein of unknown function [Evansella caseinilytica]